MLKIPPEIEQSPFFGGTLFFRSIPHSDAPFGVLVWALMREMSVARYAVDLNEKSMMAMR